MSDYPQIVRFLEAERERYILETADLERRIVFIREQINSLDTLISGYHREKQSLSSPSLSHFPQVSTQAFLEASPANLNRDTKPSSSRLDINAERENFKHEIDDVDDVDSTADESSDDEEEDVDISDIPRIAGARKPGSVMMLKQYHDYSILNAILILMRRRPRLHFHIDAIVRDLYGHKLTAEQTKSVKLSVGKMLSLGVQRGLWYRVLRGIGVYTLNHEKGVTSKLVRRK
ncbi:MAG: hypothetical protein KME64_34615 [Scytonematopsis contorta HA4267-MV1]|jgi:hypothetical protein|nr:hypothetical protein [Scytonematopsis contorta HA4267-MV1]